MGTTKAAIAGLCGLVWLFSGPAAEARPDYNKVFWDLYEKEIGIQAGTVKCAVCHDGPTKKARNDYGKVVRGKLKAQNVKGAALIKAALEAAAKEKSSVEGKTFGDLIKTGRLPGKTP